MTHVLVLQLLIEIMKFANEAVKTMPPEQAAKFWVRHEQRVEFWEGIWKELKA